MAGNANGKGLYFIVGALVVVVIGLVLYQTGALEQDEADIKIELPDVKAN